MVFGIRAGWKSGQLNQRCAFWTLEKAIQVKKGCSFGISLDTPGVHNYVQKVWKSDFVH